MIYEELGKHDVKAAKERPSWRFVFTPVIRNKYIRQSQDFVFFAIISAGLRSVSFQYSFSSCSIMKLNSSEVLSKLNSSEVQTIANSSVSDKNTTIENLTLSLGYHTMAPNYPQEFLVYLQKLQTPSLFIDLIFICRVNRKQPFFSACEL